MCPRIAYSTIFHTQLWRQLVSPPPSWASEQLPASHADEGVRPAVALFRPHVRDRFVAHRHFPSASHQVATDGDEGKATEMEESVFAKLRAVESKRCLEEV